MKLFVIITKDNIGKEIQILNCKEKINSTFYMNFKSKMMRNDLEKYCELSINDEKIIFCWNYKF